MAKKNDNVALVILGIVALVLIIKFVPLHFPFAVQSTTVCAEGIANYYPLDGSLVDLKGDMNLISAGGDYYDTGKINQGYHFNGSNYLIFPSFNSSLNAGYWMKNSTIDWTYVTGSANILTNNFGFGISNMTIDEVVIGNNVSVPFALQPCYTQIVVENLSCKDYATTKVTDIGTGCLNYSDGFFPSCTYNWVNVNKFIISDKVCKRAFYCSDGVYSDLISCNATLHPSGTVTTTTYSAQTTTETGFDLNRKVFEIAGVTITPLYLIIALLIIAGLIFLLSQKKK